MEKVKKTFQRFRSRPFLDAPDEILANDEFVFGFSLPNKGASKVTMQTRVGTDMDVLDVDGWADTSELEESCFLPHIVTQADDLANHTNLERCRQWLVVAKWQDNWIQLYCVPLLGNDRPNPQYVLTARLQLPEDRKILSLGFYGDDGKSSLSAGNDGGTGKDGPYDVAFLAKKPESSIPTLLFVPYAGIGWQALTFDSLASEYELSEECCYDIIEDSEGIDEGDDMPSNNTVVAQSKLRCGCLHETNSENS